MCKLEDGHAEYVPAGPFRRCRVSLEMRQVLGYVFWSKWPGPFLPVVDRLLLESVPMLFNITVTGLGGSAVEPGVPTAAQVLDSVRRLCQRLPQHALLWRFDPIFISRARDQRDAHRRFVGILDTMASLADRVVVSFVEPFPRRTRPDLRRYSWEQRDQVIFPSLSQKLDVLGPLAESSREAGLEMTVCCDPELAGAAGLQPAACNSFGWMARVYPELQQVQPPRLKATRRGCACWAEVDIGVYDTCTLGCRYCYASMNRAMARRRVAEHSPGDPCILPGHSGHGSPKKHTPGIWSLEAS